MGESTRNAAICAQIESAFENVPSPGATREDISQTRADEGVAKYFRGKSWRGHKDSTLRWHYCAMHYFTDKAFRYFLPAFMLSTLKAPEDAERIRESMVFRISEDGGKLLESFSTPELAALGAFLQEDIDRYGDHGRNGISLNCVLNLLRERTCNQLSDTERQSDG